MRQDAPNRGGAPVGYLTELGPVEAGAVMYLRLWCSGPDEQGRVWSDLRSHLTAPDATDAYESFETLCNLCLCHGRRPLMRHHVDCKCLGGDEACFANFIAYASEGAREDAFLMAANLVRPDMASAMVGLAERFGLALRRMSVRPPAAPTHAPAGATVH